MMPFRWPARIRFSDTDASGRIHYSSLFRHFEAAEEEFLRTLGFDYTQIGRAEVAWPRVHAECDISGALRHDDAVETQVSVARVGHSSFALAYLLENGGVECARGKVVIVCMDVATQKARPLPAAFASILRQQLAAG